VLALKNSNEAVERAKVEIEFAVRKQIQCICFNDSAYPIRLRECPDAPLVIYYRGNADLNKKRTISIVGTRQCTQYGKDALRNFFANLKLYCPDALIMSGLAYGIDICAHREALKNEYETVGVLAHGLDSLYPYAHKDTADEMINHGGLLSEYMSESRAEKGHFLARNRIIAGMSDATIVVESASHGGSLVTARLAQEYNREVFAFPGNINSETSQGCNNLIRDNGASLISSAEDFIHAMKWDDEQARNEKKKLGIERSLFMEYSDDEQTIVDLLTQDNDQQINTIAQKTGMPINKVTALMFELEMKGAVKLMAGSVYHLYQ
ncbi:MAG: DNA-processing protein DprA, partial [Prevotellaceae bacterium]|nr:DNA-processing protein DprA [Prevotellaceae bacterium]